MKFKGSREDIDEVEEHDDGTHWENKPSTVINDVMLLSVGLLTTLSIRKPIWSKYLRLGNFEAGAPDFVALNLQSRHFFRLSFRYFNYVLRNSTTTTKTNKLVKTTVN